MRTIEIYVQEILQLSMDFMIIPKTSLSSKLGNNIRVHNNQLSLTNHDSNNARTFVQYFYLPLAFPVSTFFKKKYKLKEGKGQDI